MTIKLSSFTATVTLWHLFVSHFIADILQADEEQTHLFICFAPQIAHSSHRTVFETSVLKRLPPIAMQLLCNYYQPLSQHRIFVQNHSNTPKWKTQRKHPIWGRSAIDEIVWTNCARMSWAANETNIKLWLITHCRSLILASEQQRGTPSNARSPTYQSDHSTGAGVVLLDIRKAFDSVWVGDIRTGNCSRPYHIGDATSAQNTHLSERDLPQESNLSPQIYDAATADLWLQRNVTVKASSTSMLRARSNNQQFFDTEMTN